MRPVRDDVVVALDDALTMASGGAEVLHAIDPARIVSFGKGGPAVWSVALAEIGGSEPYTLFLTYGLGHVLSPEPAREGETYELSLAVPKRCPSHPWAVALLRHLARYVRSSGNELLAGDVMPCHAPITYVPFQPEHHASMPSTSLDSIVVAPDPVLGTITTPHGPVEVRRLVGIDGPELHRLGPMKAAARASACAAMDPLLLSDIGRSNRA